MLGSFTFPRLTLFPLLDRSGQDAAVFYRPRLARPPKRERLDLDYFRCLCLLGGRLYHAAGLRISDAPRERMRLPNLVVPMCDVRHHAHHNSCYQVCHVLFPFRLAGEAQPDNRAYLQTLIVSVDPVIIPRQLLPSNIVRDIIQRLAIHRAKPCGCKLTILVVLHVFGLSYPDFPDVSPKL